MPRTLISSEQSIARAAPVIIAQRYKLLHCIGSGSFGEVHLASDLRNPWRKVAVKILRAEFNSDPFIKRFEGEGATLELLSQHPNILRVFERGELSGQHYIVTEYLDGRSLEDYLNERLLEHRILELADAAEIIRQICDALTAAHQLSVPGPIIHRDLKPGNIMLLEGTGSALQVKVLDFGIARLGDLGGSSGGLGLGTPGYMAPEQIAGDMRLLKPTVDVYALGVLAVEILTLRKATVDDLPISALSFQPPSEIVAALAKLRPNVPPSCWQAIARALSPQPKARFKDAADFRRAVLKDLPRRRQFASMPVVSDPAKSLRQRFRRYATGAFAGLTLTCALVGTLQVLLQRGPATKQAPAVTATPATRTGVSAVVETQVRPAERRPQLRAKAFSLVIDTLHADAPGLRQLAIIALTQEGDPLIRPLIEPLLLDLDEGVQVTAARALGRLRTVAAMQALKHRIRAPSTPAVAQAISESLRSDNSTLSLPATATAADVNLQSAVESFQKSGSLELRLAAAEVILRLTRQEPEQLALSSLLWIENALNDSEWTVRKQALAPLADMEPLLALPLLLRAREDRRVEVRKSVAYALGQTQSPAALQALRPLVDDPVAAVAEAAMQASGRVVHLRRLRGESLDALIAHGPALHVAHADRLALIARLDEQGVDMMRPLLGRLLHDPAPEVRRVLVSALANRALAGETFTESPLRTLIEDDDPQVRAHAAAVVSRLAAWSGGERSQHAMEAQLRGDYRRALELGREQHDVLGLFVTAAAACATAQANVARVAYEQITSLTARQQLAAMCRRQGIELQRSLHEALIREDDLRTLPSLPMPEKRTPVIPQPVPPPPVSAGFSTSEAPLRNQNIRLPQKVYDAIPPLEHPEP